jgi:hypothetical protein
MIIQPSMNSKDFILKLIFVLSLILFGLNLFLRIHIIPYYTVDIGGIEINVIDGIVKILSGEFLYTDPASPPYDVMQYSPLYYYLIAGISRLLNISSSEPQSIFIVSRIAGLLLNLLLVLIIYLTGRHFSLSKIYSSLAGIFSFIILTPHYYSRGDSLYCLLFFLSVYYFIKYLKRGKEVFFLLFIIVSFLCIMTKQSGIILPAVSGLLFIIKKKYKHLGKLVISYLVPGLLFISIAGRMGGMEAIYRNIILGVKNGTSFYMFQSFFSNKYYIQIILWIVLGFYLSSRIFIKKLETDFFFFLLLLFMSLVFGFVTGLKIGSSLNYFVECFILTFILGVIYFTSYKQDYILYGILAYFLITIFLNTGSFFSSIYISKYRTSDYSNYENEKSVFDYMLKEEKIKTGDFVYLSFRGYLELFLQPYSIMNQKDLNFYIYTYASPQIDYSTLIKQSDKGLISYIISNGSLREVEMVGYYFKNFREIKTIGNYKIYKFEKAGS